MDGMEDVNFEKSITFGIKIFRVYELPVFAFLQLSREREVYSDNAQNIFQHLVVRFRPLDFDNMDVYKLGYSVPE